MYWPIFVSKLGNKNSAHQHCSKHCFNIKTTDKKIGIISTQLRLELGLFFTRIFLLENYLLHTLLYHTVVNNIISRVILIFLGDCFHLVV